ncbi:hypothetical protein G3I43_18985, partial [Streptomyces anulatus]|nr:hypothetical protein [Streptomyces anulatus]
MNADRLPPVAPDVTATLVENLSPRLRKRLDAAVTKLGARTTRRDGDTVTIEVDDEIELRLHAPGGVVVTTDAITCGCLLAPACVHRAAAACAAPAADLAPEPVDEPTAEAPDPASVSAAASVAELASASATAPAYVTDRTPEPHRTPDPHRTSVTGPDPDPDPGPDSTTDRTHATGPAPKPALDSVSSPEVASPDQRAAADALWAAGAAVLEAGVDGAGAVS